MCCETCGATPARVADLTAQVAYTAIPEGKSKAGLVISQNSGGLFPLNPGTFRAQHGQVALSDPGSTEEYGAELVPRTVKIKDARAASKPPSLGSAGFELLASSLGAACPPDALIDSLAPHHGRAVAAYYASLEELVQNVTGAHFVSAFCHAVRSGKSAAECKGAEAGYAAYAHTDQSADSWSSKARDLVQSGDVDAFPPGICSENVQRAIAGKRWAVISAWRKLNTSQASHLAILDHRSLRSEDVLPFHIIQDRCVGGNYRLLDSEEAAKRHKWFYYPCMTPDEVLLFTAFDTAHPAADELFSQQKMTPSCVHAGFMDPTASANEPSRVSIDVRLLVVWDEDVAVN